VRFSGTSLELSETHAIAAGLRPIRPILHQRDDRRLRNVTMNPAAEDAPGRHDRLRLLDVLVVL